jgi:hypothetical protein
VTDPLASAVRDGDRLTISRIVYKPGTFEETSRLEGTASDTDIVLTGVEHVAIPDRAADDRACRVRLKRQ